MSDHQGTQIQREEFRDAVLDDMVARGQRFADQGCRCQVCTEAKVGAYITAIIDHLADVLAEHAGADHDKVIEMVIGEVRQRTARRLNQFRKTH